MDPLVVAGGLGKFVDHLLVDRDPVADAKLLANMVLQILWGFDGEHLHLPG